MFAFLGDWPCPNLVPLSVQNALAGAVLRAGACVHALVVGQLAGFPRVMLPWSCTPWLLHRAKQNTGIFPLPARKQLISAEQPPPWARCNLWKLRKEEDDWARVTANLLFNCVGFFEASCDCRHVGFSRRQGTVALALAEHLLWVMKSVTPPKLLPTLGSAWGA